MKRLVLSLLLGFLVPLVYTVIVAPLSPYFRHNRTLDFYSGVPVRWPLLLLYEFQVFPDKELWAVLLIVVCNVLLYGSLIYFILFAISKPKRTPQLPPPVHKL